ncbi:hypothetical protein ADK57_17845 [Streptomyces sp. MMG1533]|nr:hypothetical protein ADK57_17845 [Streptomyces sp. MMG1533]
MVLLSAQGMPVAKIAEVMFTSADRVRDVIHNFDTDGFVRLRTSVVRPTGLRQAVVHTASRRSFR